MGGWVDGWMGRKKFTVLDEFFRSEGVSKGYR